MLQLIQLKAAIHLSVDFSAYHKLLHQKIVMYSLERADYRPINTELSYKHFADCIPKSVHSAHHRVMRKKIHLKQGHLIETEGSSLYTTVKVSHKQITFLKRPVSFACLLSISNSSTPKR